MHTWASKYVGQVCGGERNCARLMVDVQKDVFGRIVKLPEEIENNYRTNSRIIDYVATEQFMEVRKENSIDGDVVAMRIRSYENHVGVLCVHGGERYILHTNDVTGQAILQLERNICGITRYARFVGRE